MKSAHDPLCRSLKTLHYSSSRLSVRSITSALFFLSFPLSFIQFKYNNGPFFHRVCTFPGRPVSVTDSYPIPGQETDLSHFPF